MTTLHLGSSGDEVADAQGRLAFLGFYGGPIDGQFEPAVQQAVYEYQASTGRTGTGELDETALELLRRETDSGGFNLDAAKAGAYAGHSTTRHQGHGPMSGHQRLDDHVVKGEKSGFSKEMAGSLRDMSTRAMALAGLHGAAVERAVRAFKVDFAEPRLKDLDVQLTGEDYFKYMSRYFMDEAGIFVTKLLPGPLQPVWIAFSMACSRTVATAVKHSLSLEGGLHKSLERLVVDVPSGIAAAEEELRHGLDAKLAPVFERLQNDQRLDPADDAWLAPFYQASPTQMDALLESVFGLPASATKTEEIVFERLVESFEKMYLDKTHSKSGPPAPRPKTVLFPKRETDSERFIREREEKEQVLADDHDERARRAAKSAGVFRQARQKPTDQD